MLPYECSLALRQPLQPLIPPKEHRLKEEKSVSINYITFLNITS